MWQWLKHSSLGTVTLGSSYTSGAGSMSLTTGHGARLPSSGDFWLTAEVSGTFHVWKVTARSTDTLTVTAEATEGGGDTNLSGGQTLKFSISLAAIEQFIADNCQTGAYASAVASKAGRLYLPSDRPSRYLLRDTGAAFDKWLSGRKLTPPPAASSFTWVNQGTATTDENYGGIIMIASDGSGGLNSRLLVKSAPSTPYTITAFFTVGSTMTDDQLFGLYFRQSSDGKLSSLQANVNSYSLRAVVLDWNSPTSSNALLYSSPVTFGAALGMSFAGGIWLRIEDNGTNRIYSVSSDGVYWVAVYTVGRTSFLTADQVGWGFDMRHASETRRMWLHEWIEG